MPRSQLKRKHAKQRPQSTPNSRNRTRASKDKVIYSDAAMSREMRLQAWINEKALEELHVNIINI